jgi:predicted Zn-dependent peptidase
MHPTIIHTLPNGLRILYEHHPTSQVTHVALMMKSGTRDEEEGKEGLAHFIEHSLFKGTSKRKSFHILNRLEVVGGDLNAYTTKEETCLHASIMDKHLERAVELIADIAFNSIFPEKEIEKEKDVIVDEILSYQDTPYEQIFDDFETQIFKGHPLGHPILGTEKAIRAFKRKHLIDFIKRTYHPKNMVFSVSGNAGIEEVVRLAESYFLVKASKVIATSRSVFKNYKRAEVVQERSVNQVHFISGTTAYSLNHPSRYKLVLLNNLLGGPGMNSRLNLNVREKYGFTYTIESGYHTYSDTGVFYLYFATDQKHFEKTKMLAEKELTKLVEQPITSKVFQQYKEQLLGQILMAQENRLSVMLSKSKSLLIFGKIISLEEILEKIRVITSNDIKLVAEEIFESKKRSQLIYQPKLQ